jgi:IclR family acetate operon transcriptional repressor
MSLTEAAEKVGLPASTAMRQLRSLEAAGFLRRDAADQTYRPGAQLIALSRTVFVGASLPGMAQPFLDQLARLTGESAYLAVPESSQSVVYVATAPGEHALRHSGWLGRGFPIKSTAVGAALFARTDPDGVVSRAGALEKGIAAVAAPVTSAGGRIVAAINVVGPGFRLRGARLLRARRAVADAAVGLSAVLGTEPQVPRAKGAGR